MSQQVPGTAYSFETGPGAGVLVGGIRVSGDQLSLFTSCILRQPGLYRFSHVFGETAVVGFRYFVVEVP